MIQDNKTRYEQVAEGLKYPDMYIAVRVGSVFLSSDFSKLLSAILNRDIEACVVIEDDYWGLDVYKTPLTKEEIETLFLLAEADDFDRDSNDFGEHPVMEINMGLAEKLISKSLPGLLVSSHTNGKNIWFILEKSSQSLESE